MHIDLIRDKRKTMPSLDTPGSVTSLRVWHCNYKTLDPITAFGQLRTLVIATWPDPTLESLRSLTRLEYLQVVHLPKVSSLSPLAALLGLRTLSLETLPSWDSSGKVTAVESLEPLARLPALRHLALFGVRPRDKSLEPLRACKALVSAHFSKYSRSETERFYASISVSDSHVPRWDA